MAPKAPTRRSAFLSNTKSTPSTLTSLEPAPPISLTPPASHLDNDNSNNSVDATPIFDTNSAGNSNGNSSNAANIVNARIIIASAANGSSSSHGNTIDINADSSDSGSTDISPTISVSTACENEAKPER